MRCETQAEIDRDRRGDGGWFSMLGIGESERGFMPAQLTTQAPIFCPAFAGNNVVASFACR